MRCLGLRTIAVFSVGFAALTGCNGVTSLNSAYIKADRQTKVAVDPKLETYKAEHPDEAEPAEPGRPVGARVRAGPGRPWGQH